MRVLPWLFLLVFSAALSAGEQTADLGWCSVVCPQMAGAGQKFTIKVTLKEVPAGTKLGGDIHLVKPDGTYLTYGAWGGDPRAVKAGETVSMTYTMPESKDGSGGVIVHYFLSPKGWNEKVKDGASPAIMLDAAATSKLLRPATATLKKSWIKIGKAHLSAERGPDAPWVEGEEFILPVEYYIDPTDDWGGTRMGLWALGPWVDCPDGTYTKSRGHQNYFGLDRESPCEIGKVMTMEFKLKVPKPFAGAAPEAGKMGDGMFFVLFFKGHDGKNWPWQVRGGGMGKIVRKNGFFELDAATPGNLFTYNQPVELQATLGNAAAGAGEKELKYRVLNQKGSEIAQGALKFSAQKSGQIVPLPLSLKERGTFLLSATVDGWETREITFATVPDLEKIIGDRPTPFGGQKFVGNAEAVKAARMLGMSTCRVWISWSSLEPEKGKWNEQNLEALGNNLKQLNQSHIRPWLLFDGPPAWAITNPEAHGGEFSPFPFRDEEVAAAVTRLATLYKGQISGFEWQNEIVPGKACADPVADYARFCRVATEAVKKVDSTLTTQLAGGLWPRSFRKSLLAAGVGESIDILPVHYSTRGGVEEAWSDLAAVGAQKAVVWDNETALGWSTWKMPLRTALMDNKQSNYFMQRFPDELLAGCQQIVVFGGEPDAAGNWSHFWGDMSPRPSAATLGVLVSKLGQAKPLGEFSLGKADALKLFEGPDRKAVLVVSTVEKDGESVRLPVGAKPAVATDQQGNETPVATEQGLATLSLTPDPYFVEGGDLDVLKAQLVVQVPGVSTGTPQFSFVKGAEAKLSLRVINFYDVPLRCTLRLQLPAEFGSSEARPVALKPGEQATVTLPVNVSATPAGEYAAALLTEFENKTLPVVQKRLKLNVISLDKIGNLLQNPGFETAGSSEQEAANWGGTGKNGQRVPQQEATELGHGDFVYRFTNTAGKYQSIWQSVENPGGGEYVYSLWIKSQNLQAGSNFSVTDASGATKNYDWMRIFNAPHTQEYWDVFSCRVNVPAGSKGVGSAPVCNGAGTAFIDNATLTLYEGTDYNACVPQAPGGIKIDGSLTDFSRANPIPLLGKSQLRVKDKGYVWSPANLSGAAYLNWDANNLYVGVEVLDDKNVAAQKDDACNGDDSIEIAIHPLNRQPGEDSKAFVYYISATNPGGSGKHTIFRPASHSGGLKSGSLAKDSSTYDIVIRREGSKTVYEIAIPFNDMGGVAGSVGNKFGLSLALNDNDGSGKAATMLWGEGLYPAWSPRNFGMATLVAPKK